MKKVTIPFCLIITSILVIVISLISGCKKESDITIPVTLDSTVVYQDVSKIRLDINDAKYLITRSNPSDKIYKMSETDQIGMVIFLNGTDTINFVRTNFHELLPLNKDFVLVSGVVAIKQKGIETKVVKTGEIVDTIRKQVFKELELSNSFIFRKTDGKIFFFPDEYKDLSFGKDLYNGYANINPGLAQKDNINNIYVYSYSKSVIYKIKLPTNDEAIQIIKFIKMPDEGGVIVLPFFIIDRNGDCIIKAFADYPYYVTNSGAITNIGTFKNIKDLKIIWIDSEYKDIQGEFKLIAYRNFSQIRSILKIKYPDSLLIERENFPPINSDIAIPLSVYGMIENKKNNSLIVPGICKAMELSSEYKNIDYNFFGNEGSFIADFEIHVAKDNYFIARNNIIYRYPINLSEYKGTFASSVYQNKEYRLSGFSTDYQNNSMSFVGNKKENPKEGILVMIGEEQNSVKEIPIKDIPELLNTCRIK